MKEEARIVGGNRMQSIDIDVSVKNQSILNISQKNQQFKHNLIAMNHLKNGQSVRS
jgi:autotransporter adhesin